MKNICFLLVVLLLPGTEMEAQSYHFSQFFSTPLLTNPANTGFIEGRYRLASNFRSQGTPGGSPFFTGYLSADISPFKETLTAGHKAGAGIYIMNDKSLNGGLQTSSIGMSTAYHVGLDENGENSFGVGLQGTYHQRRIDYSNLSFGSQFGSGGYDPALPQGEVFNNPKQNFFDANAGIVFNANGEDKSFFGGVAVYNILRHKESDILDEFKMPTRLVVQAGTQVFVGDYGKVYASLTHMAQGGANQTTFGGAYGIQLNERKLKNEVAVGMWYRLKDAVVPYVGYYYEGFHIGLSYDHTVSALKTGAQLRNGYELTILYTAIDKRQFKILVPWY